MLKKDVTTRYRFVPGMEVANLTLGIKKYIGCYGQIAYAGIDET